MLPKFNFFVIFLEKLIGKHRLKDEILYFCLSFIAIVRIKTDRIAVRTDGIRIDTEAILHHTNHVNRNKEEIIRQTLFQYLFHKDTNFMHTVFS